MTARFDFTERRVLVTGGRDGLFTADVEAMLLERLCETGTAVDRLHLPDATHTELSSLGRAPALGWLDGGEPAEPGC